MTISCLGLLALAPITSSSAQADTSGSSRLQNFDVSGGQTVATHKVTKNFQRSSSDSRLGQFSAIENAGNHETIMQIRTKPPAQPTSTQ